MSSVVVVSEGRPDRRAVELAAAVMRARFDADLGFHSLQAAFETLVDDPALHTAVTMVLVDAAAGWLQEIADHASHPDATPTDVRARTIELIDEWCAAKLATAADPALPSDE